jgi:DNA-binding transcriptional regulator LsrR (DeoR family)
MLYAIIFGNSCKALIWKVVMRKKLGEIDILAAAFLSGQGENQETISQSLGLSQAVVSRMLKTATKRGLIEKRFVRERVTEDELKLIQARIRPHRLLEIVSKMIAKSSEFPGPIIHVYPSDSRNTSAASWRNRLDKFAQACARDVFEVLGPTATIGVSWGETVARVIAAIKDLPINLVTSKQSARRVVPLIGEPLGLYVTQHSSSVLAASLEEGLNQGIASEPKHTLSLAPVPALIPWDLEESEVAAIRKLIGRITAYHEIFGEGEDKPNDGDAESPLIWQIDALLTSTSVEGRPLGFDDDSLIRAAGVDRDKLNELVMGDLGGALIPRSRLDGKSKAEVAGILRRWFGVRVSHIRNCSARARKGAPGVLLLAIGANKAPVVHAALCRGLVQHLFIDQDLADRLEQICSASMQAHQTPA